MVFLTVLNMARNISCPNKFWRVQQMKRMAWKFGNRNRNCFSIGIKDVNKALMRSTIARKTRRQEIKTIWNTRIHAGAMEHGMKGEQLREGLVRSNIELDRKVLNDLAIYEPRTFQSLCEISKAKLESEGIADPYMTPPKGIVHRGDL